MEGRTNRASSKRRTKIPEKKDTEQHLSKEKNELKHLKNLENTLLTNLESFADVNFPTDVTGQKYTTILQYLGRLMEINMDEQARERVKRKICRCLKQGEIDAAYEIVNENLRDKYKIYELP